jgi:hypothetical protein
MDPTNFTLSDDKSSIKFHRAIEPNNPLSTSASGYISLKADAFHAGKFHLILRGDQSQG